METADRQVAIGEIQTFFRVVEDHVTSLKDSWRVSTATYSLGPDLDNIAEMIASFEWATGLGDNEKIEADVLTALERLPNRPLRRRIARTSLPRSICLCFPAAVSIRQQSSSPQKFSEPNSNVVVNRKGPTGGSTTPRLDRPCRFHPRAPRKGHRRPKGTDSCRTFEDVLCAGDIFRAFEQDRTPVRFQPDIAWPADQAFRT